MIYHKFIEEEEEEREKKVKEQCSIIEIIIKNIIV